MKRRHAFTLIEMLVVIAIIGIVAAMVINMNSGAQTAKRNAQVNGDKAKLTLLIDNYQSKLNFYPPDNTNLDGYAPGPIYDGYAATNPLIYELTGATNLTNGNIQLFDSTNTSQSFYNMYGRFAVANANPDEPHSFYIPQPKEYTNYYVGTFLEGLVVPVSLIATNANFWHYDASSTNRHNLSSYDLWAEYVSAGKNGVNIITTNGNW